MIVLEGVGTFNCQSGQSLLEALNAAGTVAESPCGGKGTCGKCLVKIIQGAVLPPADDEIKLIDENSLAANWRLACLLYPQGDLTVSLPESRKRDRILTVGLKPEFEFCPSIRKVFFEIPKRDSADNRAADQRLAEIIKNHGHNHVNNLEHNHRHQAGLDFYKTLAPLKIGYVSGESSCTVVFDQGRPLLVEAGDTRKFSYGLALDIGTTTMVLALVNLSDGQEVGSASMINPQTRYGLDVLSRIAYAQEHETSGLQALRTAVTNGVEELAQ
ncbi:MAG: 2Fe-2S iron-sulfur cluster binding domain-containing protein, partial [Deltaproteobacteria bacterium]|nr:2Fe-2S iron-sulfur cluster binding domain-containing protein [Deltaproteobacteria bacterium]